MVTDSDRISRLEGAYEHLATKADIGEMKTVIAELKAEMRLQRWLSLAVLASSSQRPRGKSSLEL